MDARGEDATRGALGLLPHEEALEVMGRARPSARDPWSQGEETEMAAVGATIRAARGADRAARLAPRSGAVAVERERACAR
eukprot:2731002-Pyramimonas_sp.AAC.1